MFYEQLDRECAKAGMSVSSFLDNIGLSRGNISKWKNGSEPRNKTKVQIAEALGLDKEYFLNDDRPGISYQSKAKTSTKKPPADAEGMYYMDLSEEESAILELFRSRPPEIQAAAMAVLKSASPRPDALDADDKD